MLVGALALRAHNDSKQRAAVKAAVTRQDRDQGTLYAGPSVEFRYSSSMGVRDSALTRLTAYYPRTGGAPVYCLYWMIGYFSQAGAYFDRAALSDSTSLHVHIPSSHVILCSTSDLCISKEEVTVTLPYGAVVAAEKNGLKIDLRALDNIERSVYISAPYVQGFVSAAPSPPSVTSNTATDADMICGSL